MLKQNFFSKTKRYQQISTVLVVLTVAVIGTLLLISSHAATPYSTVAADKGTLTGVATIKTDSTASDGNYVQFGSSGTSPSFQAGLDMRAWPANDTAANNILHAKIMRWEVPASDPNSGTIGVTFYASLGALPQPLIGFTGVPSNAAVDGVAAWAKSQAGKIKVIEWGNEDSYTYKYNDGPGNASYESRARAYALAAQRLAQDLVGSGVSIIAQADDGDTGSSDWVDQMFAAVPDLQNYVTGWSLHPYGPSYMNNINRLVSQVGKHVSVVKPIYITEWGLASDNGRNLTDNYGYPTNMTYQQAADTLNSVVPSIHATGKVAEFMLYQSTDQNTSGASSNREDYFGAVQADGSTPKGAYTQAVTNMLKTF